MLSLLLFVVGARSVSNARFERRTMCDECSYCRDLPKPGQLPREPQLMLPRITSPNSTLFYFIASHPTSGNAMVRGLFQDGTGTATCDKRAKLKANSQHDKQTWYVRESDGTSHTLHCHHGSDGTFPVRPDADEAIGIALVKTHTIPVSRSVCSCSVCVLACTVY